MMFSVIVPLSFRRSGSSSLFFPNSAHSPAVPVHGVTFYFDRGHMQPSFSRLGAQLCTTRQKISWIVQVFIVSIKTCCLSGASVRNSPAESTLPLPSLYNFEFLRIFVRKLYTGKWTGFQVPSGLKLFKKMMIEIRVLLEELSEMQ